MTSCKLFPGPHSSLTAVRAHHAQGFYQADLYRLSPPSLASALRAGPYYAQSPPPASAAGCPAIWAGCGATPSGSTQSGRRRKRCRAGTAWPPGCPQSSGRRCRCTRALSGAGRSTPAPSQLGAGGRTRWAKVGWWPSTGSSRWQTQGGTICRQVTISAMLETDRQCSEGCRHAAPPSRQDCSCTLRKPALR